MVPGQAFQPGPVRAVRARYRERRGRSTQDCRGEWRRLIHSAAPGWPGRSVAQAAAHMNATRPHQAPGASCPDSTPDSSESQPRPVFSEFRPGIPGPGAPSLRCVDRRSQTSLWQRPGLAHDTGWESGGELPRPALACSMIPLQRMVAELLAFMRHPLSRALFASLGRSDRRRHGRVVGPARVGPRGDRDADSREACKRAHGPGPTRSGTAAPFKRPCPSCS